MTKENAKAIGRTAAEIEAAIETVRLYLGWELAQSMELNASGTVNINRDYEKEIHRALKPIDNFCWDEER